MYKRFYRKRKTQPKETKATVEFSCMPRQLDHYVGILIPNKIVDNLQLNTKRRWKIAVSKNRLQLKNAATPQRRPWNTARFARRGGYFSGQ